MKTAVFAYRKESPQSGLLTGKPELFKMLEERGIDAAVSYAATLPIRFIRPYMATVLR